MGHGDGLVGDGVAAGAHVVDDHGRGVLGGGVADLVPERAVPLGDERDPVLARAGAGREAGVGVAGLPLGGRRGHQHLAAGIQLGRLLPVAAALALLAAQLSRAAAAGLGVGDVHEGRVPLLFLGHREIQAQQMHETKGEQPC